MPPYNPGAGFRKSSRTFGHRKHPITGKISGHSGDDWPAPSGTPIPAAYDGKVLENRYQYNEATGTGWGWFIVLEHEIRGKRILTRYAHMRVKSALGVGELVGKGKEIGEVGSTGGSTGPHLHFEVIADGVPIDPGAFDFPESHSVGTAGFVYPFPSKTTEAEAEGAAEFAQHQFDAIAHAEDGFYPIGNNGQWHGGIHYGTQTAELLDQDRGVRCIAGGEVIAYRIDDQTYPEVEYTGRGKARYSSGFVLVRHSLVLPPNAVQGRAGAVGKVEEAGDQLVFYSLYMHLLSWKGYLDDRDKPRPKYWAGAEEFIVGSKAQDKEDSLAPGEVGIRIRDDTHAPVALLPRGSSLTLGAPHPTRRGYFTVGQILRGTTVPAGLTEGYVYKGELDVQTTPAVRGSVVVLNKPHAVEAGEVLGYMGEYQRYADVHPLASSVAGRSLIHIEVFSAQEMDKFIARSRERARTLDDSTRTLLHVMTSARLVEPSAPDLDISEGDGLVADAVVEGADGWVKARRGSIRTVSRSELGEFTSASASYARGHYLWRMIRPGDNMQVDYATYLALSKEQQGLYTQRQVISIAGDPVWVSVGDLSGRDRVAGRPLRGWSRFPLQLPGDGAVVEHDMVAAIDSLPGLSGPEGGRWWQVKVGSGGEGVIGWVCERGHDKVRCCSPWDWPGFEVLDTGNVVPAVLYANHVTKHKLAQPAERRDIEVQGAPAESSTLFRRLHNGIDLNGDEKLDTDELRLALRKPWLSQAIARLVVRHPSEWGGGTSRWDEVDELIPDVSKADWSMEKQRIAKLQWWGEVAGKHGFPGDPTVYFLHPLGLVSNFGATGICNCNCVNVEKFIAEYRRRHGDFSNSQGKTLDSLSEKHLMVLIEGIVDYYRSQREECLIPHVAYMLATARHETLWRDIYFEPRTEGGGRSYFNKYDPVLASTQAHRDRARAMGNTQEGDGYQYRGRGYVQLTWKANYEVCSKELGVDLVGNPDLALDPAVASGCMMYGMFHGIFTGRKISNYIDATRKDYFNARRVINGLDKAAVIQGHAEIFESILEASKC